MSSGVPQFERLDEWEEIAAKLVEQYPIEFGHIDVSKIICYIITNKEPKDVSKLYEIQVDSLPMRLTNTHDYFVWFKHPNVWNERPENIRVNLVADALLRIDSEDPYKIKPYDYKDNPVMVSTHGAYWFDNPSIVNPLTSKVKFRTGLE